MLRRLPMLVTVAALALSTAPSAMAQFDSAEEDAIRLIVRNYLIENPEVLVEALQIYQARQEEADALAQQEAVASLGERLFESGAPAIGPEDASVTLVEFFDYNCGFCKRALDDVQTLSETDDDLRIVFLEIPILGPSSVTASRAALASREQGLYNEYHVALMSYRGTHSDESIFALAEEVGLDIDQLRIDMESEAVSQEISDNLLLAEAVGVRGTPAFVVGERVIPGAVGLRALEDAIDYARQES
ncbi:MAG: DsbA family protein [Pseudomonadota bacterium]